MTEIDTDKLVKRLLSAKMPNGRAMSSGEMIAAMGKAADTIGKLRAKIAGMEIELHGVPAPKNYRSVSIFELHKDHALGKDKA